MKRIALLTVSVIGLSALGACCQVPTPAQSASFSALNQAWPSVQMQAEAGADYLLETGQVNEAGKEVLDARTEAFGQLLSDLQSGGQ
jgi:hypothetical protein